MQEQHSENGSWRPDEAGWLMALLMGGARQYGIALMDDEGRVTGWNEGGHAITGFTADDVVGRSLAVFFTPEDVARELHVHELNSARQLGGAEDERWHARKDGSRFWASGWTMRLNMGDRQGFAKLFRDATHLRLRMDFQENEMRRMRKERGEHDMFLASIAHELRNPLQPMTAATRLLARPTGHDHQEQVVRILDRQLGFIGRLVEDLIDMTRVNGGTMNIDYRSVQLQSLVNEAVESRAELAAAKNISLECVVPAVPIEVEVDLQRINQVLVNLLNNAIKFTPAGGSVALLANVDDSHFTVKVQDTGIGIAPDMQPRIFEMFTRAESLDTRRGQGLGIGLALVKQIVALHHGSVEVRSEGIGKGSEFLVRIPIHERPHDVPPAARLET